MNENNSFKEIIDKIEQNKYNNSTNTNLRRKGVVICQSQQQN